MIILLLLIASTKAFTTRENQLLRDLIGYFQPPSVDLLVDDLPASVSFGADDAFPPRISIITGVVGPEQLVRKLPAAATRRGALSLVAARHGTKSWDTFTQIAESLVMQSAKWILFANSSSLSIINRLYIPFDCQFIIVNMEGALAMITEVYHIAEGEPVQSVHFGYWDPVMGLVTPRKDFYERRPNFKGQTFSAAIKHLRPYTYINDHSNGSTSFDGYFYEVWKELEFRLKFRTVFTKVGKGESTLDALKTRNCSFSVSPVVQDSKSFDAVDLIQPIYEPKIYLFGRRPGSELEWNSYLKPFSTETWLTVLGWIFGSAGALACLYRLAWTYHPAEHDGGHYVFTFSVSLQTAFRAACGQGSDVTPDSPSCRVLFLSIYMTALVLTSAFSAALFSLLTVPVSREPFTSFQQVYNTRSYKLGIVPESDVFDGIKDLAERQPNSDRGKLFRMLEPSANLPLTIVEALERICKRSDYILMWDLPGVLLRMQKISQECRERIMPGGPMVFNEYMGFGTFKGSPYKGLINLHLIRMKNEGLISRLLMNAWPPSIPNVQTSWVRVTLDDISPILYMFALGAILGVTILALENACARTRKKKNAIYVDRMDYYVPDRKKEHSEKVLINRRQRNSDIFNRHEKKIH